MSNINSMLEKIYERNPENGNFIIEISLDNYAEIFNEWDHAPFKRKDINPELLNFLEDSIDDIPMKNDIDLCFFLSEETRNEKREQLILNWFNTFYNFYIELEKTKMKLKIKNSIILLKISLLLLGTSNMGLNASNNFINYLLTEVIVVGGWVFLWEAISILTFERAKISKLIKNYSRFANAQILFRYN